MTMSKTNTEIKSEILEKALPLIAFDGWSDILLDNATKDAGYEVDMHRAVFPEGIEDLIDYFSLWCDDKMLAALKAENTDELRTHEKVELAVEKRLEILKPHKEAIASATKYWAVPPRGLHAKRILWRSADKIWDWAGDTATDYNRYTKRGLLVLVMSSTFAYWLTRKENDLMMTKAFLNERIRNVLFIGKGIHKLKSFKPYDLFAQAQNFTSRFSTRG